MGRVQRRPVRRDRRVRLTPGRVARALAVVCPPRLLAAPRTPRRLWPRPAAPRASAAAGCPRRRRQRAPRPGAASTAAASRRARSACVRAAWRRSASGSMRVQLDRLLDRLGVAVDAHDHLVARLHRAGGGRRRPVRSDPAPSRSRPPPRHRPGGRSRRSARAPAPPARPSAPRCSSCRRAGRRWRWRRPRWPGSAGCAGRWWRFARWAGPAPRRSRWCAALARRRRRPRSAWIATRTMLFSGCWAVSVEPPVWAWKRSIRRALVGRAEAVAHDLGPQHARGAELGDLLEEVVVGVEEERQPAGEARPPPARPRPPPAT